MTTYSQPVFPGHLQQANDVHVVSKLRYYDNGGASALY